MGRDEQAEYRGYLGKFKDKNKNENSVWYHNDSYMSLFIYINPKNVQH